MAEVVLFLSPHLDDAVLSCAGRIYMEAQAGRHVVVATVFSTGDGSEESRQNFERRWAEDLAAMELLGAEPIRLNLPDAPFRRDYYRSFRQIVLETHPEDVGYAAQVAECVAALCADTKPARLYAPLGVGTHIDHRLTHAAVGRQSGTPNITYYEERPYALIRYATRMRLAQLGLAWESTSGATDLEPMSEEVLKKSFLESFDAAHWTHTYLPTGPERDACRAKLATCMLHGRPDATRTYRSEVQAYGSDVFYHVTAAVAAYSSQFPDLFASREDFVAQTHDYSVLLGAGRMYAERYWTEGDRSW